MLSLPFNCRAFAPPVGFPLVLQQLQKPRRASKGCGKIVSSVMTLHGSQHPITMKRAYRD